MDEQEQILLQQLQEAQLVSQKTGWTHTFPKDLPSYAQLRCKLRKNQIQPHPLGINPTFYKNSVKLKLPIKMKTRLKVYRHFLKFYIQN